MPDLFYRRRLPHWVPENETIFVTWRLAGSLPPARVRDSNEVLDRCETGPTWLADERIASKVQQLLLFGDRERRLYSLHAWVIMPNHVHAVIDPKIPLPKIMQWIKLRTARRANQILGRTGEPFWQDESYDHWIRSDQELERAIAYVERNPVMAGLVQNEDDWPWSSASKVLWGR